MCWREEVVSLRPREEGWASLEEDWSSEVRMLLSGAVLMEVWELCRVAATAPPAPPLAVPGLVQPLREEGWKKVVECSVEEWWEEVGEVGLCGSMKVEVAAD